MNKNDFEAFMVVGNALAILYLIILSLSPRFMLYVAQRLTARAKALNASRLVYAAVHAEHMQAAAGPEVAAPVLAQPEIAEER
jgi:hypothetical protein